MSVFKASNGMEVTLWQECVGWEHTRLPYGATVALREFFRHKEDERLGRWRWPENPDYVVYPPDRVPNGGGGVWVLCESDPGSIRYSAPSDKTTDPSEEGYDRAARAYFDAHPEPKPWEDAEPGDVWVITLTDRSFDPVAATWNGRGFVHIDVKPTEIPPHDIAGARRIWPEAMS